MDNKDGERINEAVGLWNAAYEALEARNILGYLERAMAFHDYMISHELLTDDHAKAAIKAKARSFSDETFLYRFPSVASYLSRSSADGADIMTQFSTLKVLNNEFLDYAAQDKFQPDVTRSTLDYDKKIAGDILLYCARDKVRKHILSHFNDPVRREELLCSLQRCNNCDAVVDLYTHKFGFNLIANILAEIEKAAHKSFIIEHADYMDAKKLIDCEACNVALRSENEPELREFRAAVEKAAIARLGQLSDEERLTTVLSLIDKNHPGSQSPRRVTPFVQHAVYELFRNSAFKTTEQMRNLSANMLKMLKDVVDVQIEKIARPQSGSLVALVRHHVSGEVKEKKSLVRINTELASMIKAKEPSADVENRY